MDAYMRTEDLQGCGAKVVHKASSEPGLSLLEGYHRIASHRYKS